MLQNNIKWIEYSEGVIPTLGEVYVWKCETKASNQLIDYYKTLLNDAELARAARFHFERDRVRFIVARSVLRLILSRYLHLVPQDIAFQKTEHGKLFLPKHSNPHAIKFNLSHTEQLALYAFTIKHSIGIDVESIHRQIDITALAKRFFSPVEYEELSHCSGKQKVFAFFSGWTRKEAFIKATGQGLSFPLNHFVVTLHPDKQSKIISINGDEQAARNWSLISFIPQNDYIAAIACEASVNKIYYWQWNHEST